MYLDKKNLISPENKRVLHSWFDLNIDNPYASTEEFKDLRTLTNLSQLVIKRWLQNRRSKLRKTGEMQLENNNLTKENRIHLSNK